MTYEEQIYAKQHFTASCWDCAKKTGENTNFTYKPEDIVTGRNEKGLKTTHVFCPTCGSVIYTEDYKF